MIKVNDIQDKINELYRKIFWIKMKEFTTENDWNIISETEKEIEELKKQLPKIGVYVKLNKRSYFTGDPILSYGEKEEARLFKDEEEAISYLQKMDGYTPDLPYEFIYNR